MNISAHSDLEIIIVFKDNTSGQEIPVPSYDFALSFYVYTDKVRTVTQTNKVLPSNCKIVDGRLHIYFDSPDFGVGPLRTRHLLRVPNPDFPDQRRDIVREGCLDCNMVEHPCEYSEDPIVTCVVITEEYSIVELLSTEDNKFITTEDGINILLYKDYGRN